MLLICVVCSVILNSILKALKLNENNIEALLMLARYKFNNDDLEAAEKGKSYAEGILTKGVERKKVTEEKKADVLGRITTTADYADLAGCDLIVEAVFEDPGIKAKVTEATEAAIPEDAIFASNTSTLPITGLAEASSRPENFIGLHFFSPVDKMLLVS